MYVLPLTAVTFTICTWLRKTLLMVRPPLPPSSEQGAVVLSHTKKSEPTLVSLA